MAKTFLTGLLLSLSLLVTGCDDPVPMKGIYELYFELDAQGKPTRLECGFFPIVKENPLTFGDGVNVPLTKCPRAVYGIDYRETEGVMNWIRNKQNQCR